MKSRACFLVLAVSIFLGGCQLLDDGRDTCPELWEDIVYVVPVDTLTGFTGYIKGTWRKFSCPDDNFKVVQLSVDSGRSYKDPPGYGQQFAYGSTVEVYVQRTAGNGPIVMRWGNWIDGWDTLHPGVMVYHETR